MLGSPGYFCPVNFGRYSLSYALCPLHSCFHNPFRRRNNESECGAVAKEWPYSGRAMPNFMHQTSSGTLTATGFALLLIACIIGFSGGFNFLLPSYSQEEPKWEELSPEEKGDLYRSIPGETQDFYQRRMTRRNKLFHSENAYSFFYVSGECNKPPEHRDKVAFERHLRNFLRGMCSEGGHGKDMACDFLRTLREMGCIPFEEIEKLAQEHRLRCEW